MALQLDPLDPLAALEGFGETRDASRQPNGRPMTLPIDTIDEDEGQVRTEFDPEPLGELADSIRERGVRQPVSVRSHPSRPGRWLLNFGARRLRASKLAGLTDIPAFVDETADSYDQVVENEQREGLKPLELALFVQRRLRAGDHQAGIAKRLGKSRAYLTYVCSMIDPPDWLMALYRAGKCRGVKELYDLRRLHVDHPAEIVELARTRNMVTRGDIREFEAGLSAAPATVSPSSTLEFVASPPASGVAGVKAAATRRSKDTVAVDPTSQWELWAEWSGQQVRVVLDVPPPDRNEVVTVSTDNASRVIGLDQLRSLRLTRR